MWIVAVDALVVVGVDAGFQLHRRGENELTTWPMPSGQMCATARCA